MEEIDVLLLLCGIIQLQFGFCFVDIYSCFSSAMHDETRKGDSNDILPHTAARREAIANLKLLGLDRYLHIRYAAPPYAAGPIIIASIYGKVGENTGPIFRCLWTKVREIVGHYETLGSFQAFPLVGVPFQR